LPKFAKDNKDILTEAFNGIVPPLFTKLITENIENNLPGKDEKLTEEWCLAFYNWNLLLPLDKQWMLFPDYSSCTFITFSEVYLQSLMFELITKRLLGTAAVGVESETHKKRLVHFFETHKKRLVHIRLWCGG
jgi:hypothetical protein